ncbi:protein bassoon [Nothoprocta perdicaria]|uniref:protein bassoon n=1 Tax=Nothoprocta perdicaria TaxID=30464 RepID=UPI000E1C146C|nr:protein bassoon [Nothoprocta perdicaria]
MAVSKLKHELDLGHHSPSLVAMSKLKHELDLGHHSPSLMAVSELKHELEIPEPAAPADRHPSPARNLRAAEPSRTPGAAPEKKPPAVVEEKPPPKLPVEIPKAAESAAPKGKSPAAKAEAESKESRAPSEAPRAKETEEASKPYPPDLSRSPQSLSDTGYSSDGISSSQSEITGLVQQEEEKLSGTGLAEQSPPSPSELTKLESSMRPLLEAKGASQEAGERGKGYAELREEQRQRQRPRYLSITPEAFDSDEELEDILEEDEDSLEWENQREQRESMESSDEFGSKLRHDYVEDSSEGGFSPVPGRPAGREAEVTDEEFMRRQILEMSAEEDNLEEEEEEGYSHLQYSVAKTGPKPEAEKSKEPPPAKRRLPHGSGSLYKEERKELDAAEGDDVSTAQGGLRRFKTIELNSTNGYGRDLEGRQEADASLDREPELEMESLTGSPEERSRGEYSTSTLPATTPSYTSGTSPTSISSLEEDSDSSPSRRQRLEEVKQQRKARHRSHGPLLPTIEDSSEEEELREEEELLREQEKMREVEQQRIRSTARKTKRDKEELRAQRRRERSKTPPSNLSPIEDASPTEELRQAAEMEELHRSSCSEYSPSVDSEAESFDAMASKLYKSGSEYNLPAFMSLYSPTEKAEGGSSQPASKPLKSAEEAYEEMMRKAELMQKQQGQQAQQGASYGGYQQLGYRGAEAQSTFEYRYLDEYRYEGGTGHPAQPDYQGGLSKAGAVYEEILQTSQSISRMHQSSSLDLALEQQEKKKGPDEALAYQEKRFLHAESAYADLLKQNGGPLTPGTSPTQLSAPVSFSASDGGAGKVIPDVRVTQHFAKEGQEAAKLRGAAAGPAAKEAPAPLAADASSQTRAGGDSASPAGSPSRPPTVHSYSQTLEQELPGAYGKVPPAKEPPAGGPKGPVAAGLYAWGALPAENISLCRISSIPGTSRVEPGPKAPSSNAVDLRTAIKAAPIIITDQGMDLTSLATETRKYCLTLDQIPSRQSTAIQPLIINLNAQEQPHAVLAAATSATVAIASPLLLSQPKQPVVYGDPFQNRMDFGQGAGSPVCLAQAKQVEQGVQTGAFRASGAAAPGKAEAAAPQPAKFARYNLPSQMAPLVKKDVLLAQSANAPNVLGMSSVAQAFPPEPSSELYRAVPVELKSQSPLMALGGKKSQVMMVQVEDVAAGPVTKVVKEEPPGSVLDLTGMKSESQVACCDVVYKFPFGSSCTGAFNPSSKMPEKKGGDAVAGRKPGGPYYGSKEAEGPEAFPYREQPALYEEHKFYPAGMFGRLYSSMSDTNLSEMGMNYYPTKGDQPFHGAAGDAAVDLSTMKHSYSVSFTEGGFLGHGAQYGSFSDLRQPSELLSHPLPMRRYSSASNIYSDYRYSPRGEPANLQESSLAHYSATTAREISRMCAALNSMEQYGGRHAAGADLLPYGPGAFPSGATVRAADGMIYSTINTPIASTLPITTQPASVLRPLLRGLYRPYGPGGLAAVPLASLTRVPVVAPRMPLPAQGFYRYPAPGRFPAASAPAVMETPVYLGKPVSTATGAVAKAPGTTGPQRAEAAREEGPAAGAKESVQAAPAAAAVPKAEAAPAAGPARDEREREEERQRKQQEHEELERERVELQRHREKEQLLVHRELQELQSIKHQVLQQQQEERHAQLALQREQLAAARLPPAPDGAADVPRGLPPNGQFWPPPGQAFVGAPGAGQEAPAGPRYPGLPRPLSSSASDMSLQAEEPWEAGRGMKKRNSMPRLRDAYDKEVVVKKIADSSVQTDEEDGEERYLLSRRRRPRRSTDCSVQTDEEDSGEWEQPVRRRRARPSRHADAEGKPEGAARGTASVAIQTISDCSVQTEPDQLHRVSPSIHITTHDPRVEIVKYISAPEKTQRGESLACQTEPEAPPPGIVVPQLTVPTTITPYSANLQMGSAGPLDPHAVRQPTLGKFEKKKPDPLEIGYQAHLPGDSLSQLVTRQPPRSPQVLYSPVSPLSPHRLLESSFATSERLNKAHVPPQKHFTADPAQRQQSLPRPIKTMQRSLSDPKPISPTSEEAGKDRFSLYQHPLLPGSQLASLQASALTRKVKRTLPSPPPEEPHVPLASQAAPHMYLASLAPKALAGAAAAAAVQVTKASLLKDIDRDLKLVEHESTKLRKKQAELDEEEKEIDAKLKYLELGITQRKESLLKDRSGRDYPYLRGLGENRDYMSDSELNNLRLSGYEGAGLLARPAAAPPAQYADFAGAPYTSSQADVPAPPHKPRQTSLADLEQKIATNYETVGGPAGAAASTAPTAAFGTATVTSGYEQYKAAEARPAGGTPSAAGGYSSSESLYTNLEQNIPRNYVMIDDISELTKESPAGDGHKGQPQSANGRHGKEKGELAEPEGSSRACCYAKAEEESEEDVYDHHGAEHRGRNSYHRESNGRTPGGSGSSAYYYGDSDYRHSSRADKHGPGVAVPKHSSKNLAPAVVSSKRSKHRKQGMEQKISKFSPIEEAKDVESDLASYAVSTSVSSSNVASRAKKLQDEITYGLKKNVYEQQKYYGMAGRDLVDEDERVYAAASRTRSSGYGADKASSRDGGGRSKSYERESVERAQKGSSKPSSLGMSQSRGRTPVRAQASEEESPMSPLGKSMGVSRSSGGPGPQPAGEPCSQFCSSHSLPDVQEHIKDVPRHHPYKHEEGYVVDDSHCVVSDSEAYHLGQEETDWFDKPREARAERVRHYGGHSSSQKRPPPKHSYHDYDEPPDDEPWPRDEYTPAPREHRHHGDYGRPAARHAQQQQQQPGPAQPPGKAPAALHAQQGGHQAMPVSAGSASTPGDRLRT